MGPGLTQIFLLGKSSQNSTEPVLILWTIVCHLFCFYIVKSCSLLSFEYSVHVSDGFPKKSCLDGGGWCELYPVIFWIFLSLQNPLMMSDCVRLLVARRIASAVV